LRFLLFFNIIACNKNTVSDRRGSGLQKIIRQDCLETCLIVSFKTIIVSQGRPNEQKILDSYGNNAAFSGR
jgi:hypothetical protein